MLVVWKPASTPSLGLEANVIVNFFFFLVVVFVLVFNLRQKWGSEAEFCRKEGVLVAF